MNHKLSKKDTFYGYLFVAPQIIGLVLFVLIPLLFALYLCFCDHSINTGPLTHMKTR